MTEFVFIYVTHPDAAQAAILGRALVEQRLAACVNILPGMQTIYRWNDAIEDGHEAVMIVKTRFTLFEDVRSLILRQHPYECPCIVALPVADGHPDYLAWLARESG